MNGRQENLACYIFQRDHNRFPGLAQTNHVFTPVSSAKKPHAKEICSGLVWHLISARQNKKRGKRKALPPSGGSG
jgi:hypothetical protein